MFIEIHHGGRFETVRKKKVYKGGNIDYIRDFDTDKFSWLELIYLLRKFNVKQDYEVYQLLPNKTLDNGLVLIENDLGVLSAMGTLDVGVNIVLYIKHLEEGMGKVELLPEYCKIDSPTHEAGNSSQPMELSDEIVTQAYEAVMMSTAVIQQIERTTQTASIPDVLSDELMSQVYDDVMSQRKDERMKKTYKGKEIMNETEEDAGNEMEKKAAEIGLEKEIENESRKDDDFDCIYDIDLDCSQKVVWGDSDEDYDDDEDYEVQDSSSSEEEGETETMREGTEEVQAQASAERIASIGKPMREGTEEVQAQASAERIASIEKPMKQQNSEFLVGTECDPVGDTLSQYSDSQSLRSIHKEEEEEVTGKNTEGVFYNKKRHSNKDKPELGMRFENAAEFRAMLRGYSIANGKDLIWKRMMAQG